MVARGIRVAEVVRSNRTTQTTFELITLRRMKGGFYPMLVPVVHMKQTGQKIVSLRTQRGISVRDLQLMLGLTTPQSIL